MNKVIRVFGTIDSYYVELEEQGGGRWSCTIPPDMVDGQYACMLYALDEDGDIGFWCGMVYLSSGRVCLELNNDPIGFTLMHETLSFATVEETLTFSVVKECDCCA